MRSRGTVPAEQLRSVALRYRRGGLSAARRCRPDGAAPPHQAWPVWLAIADGSNQGEGDDQRLARLEAVLFLAREPFSSRKLSQYAGLTDGTEARTLVRQLNQRYDRRGCAFRVEQVAGGYQLLTRAKFANWLRRLDGTPGELRLSAPAMETLAVVAYRQPVARADIEAIRGVGCGELLRQLMQRDLVRISGRSEELGRPYLYATTRYFLQVFGLRSLDQLPRADRLRNPARANRTQPAETPPGQTAKQSCSESMDSQ